MDEYEKIRQRKREEYRKRHRAQVRRKQLIGNGIVIGMIILKLATIISVGALRGKKAKQEEVKAEVTSTLYNPIQPKLDVALLMSLCLVKQSRLPKQEGCFYRVPKVRKAPLSRQS